ncbi:hypothetical protein Hanom_Chr02g00129711 [Helianthus anomalus]
MILFRSVCRVKLITFTHQFAYNFLESDIEFKIEQKSTCAKNQTNMTNIGIKIHCFINIELFRVCKMISQAQMSQAALLLFH